MTNLTKEEVAEIQRIVDGAPQGATHVDEDGDFWIIGQHHSEQCVLIYKDGLEECYCEPNVEISSLDDLRTIIAQHEEIDRLRDALKPFATFACSPRGECGCNNCVARDLLKGESE